MQAGIDFPLPWLCLEIMIPLPHQYQVLPLDGNEIYPQFVPARAKQYLSKTESHDNFSKTGVKRFDPVYNVLLYHISRFNFPVRPSFIDKEVKGKTREF